MTAPITIANAAARLKRRAPFAPRRKRRLPALLLMTDAARLADPLAVIDRLPKGAGVVLRDYRDAGNDAARLAAARRLRRACRARGLVLIVAGDARFALAVGAEGLHLPEWRLARAGAAVRLMRAKRGTFVTAACHSARALVAAGRAGADAAVLAPVFPTQSHPEARSIGALRFAALVRGAGLPVYALGGIDTKAARRLSASGAIGVAGIGFAAAPSP